MIRTRKARAAYHNRMARMAIAHKAATVIGFALATVALVAIANMAGIAAATF